MRGVGRAPHESEVWKNRYLLDRLTPEESLARHGRMMAVIAKRIEAIRVRLGGSGLV